MAKDNFIYFLGGAVRGSYLNDAFRYNLCTEEWQKIADKHEERMQACGAAGTEIFTLLGETPRKEVGQNLVKCTTKQQMSGS